MLNLKSDSNTIGGNKIDDKIANLSSNMKKISSKVGLFISKASLAFIQFRKVFNKTLILYNFDFKHYIWIEINGSSYVIDRILS